jgi:hypothetical protein
VDENWTHDKEGDPFAKLWKEFGDEGMLISKKRYIELYGDKKIGSISYGLTEEFFGDDATNALFTIAEANETVAQVTKRYADCLEHAVKAEFEYVTMFRFASTPQQLGIDMVVASIRKHCQKDTKLKRINLVVKTQAEWARLNTLPVLAKSPISAQ